MHSPVPEPIKRAKAFQLAWVQATQATRHTTSETWLWLVPLAVRFSSKNDKVTISLHKTSYGNPLWNYLESEDYSAEDLLMLEKGNQMLSPFPTEMPSTAISTLQCSRSALFPPPHFLSLPVPPFPIQGIKRGEGAEWTNTWTEMSTPSPICYKMQPF